MSLIYDDIRISWTGWTRFCGVMCFPSLPEALLCGFPARRRRKYNFHQAERQRQHQEAAFTLIHPHNNLLCTISAVNYPFFQPIFNLFGSSGEICAILNASVMHLQLQEMMECRFCWSFCHKKCTCSTFLLLKIASVRLELFLCLLTNITRNNNKLVFKRCFILTRNWQKHDALWDFSFS